ncbi:MAG: hypothetical protein KA436_03795 [Oligoflexales bacterium]|nr:hypothetical protein [Oligoflexales bacterium]
MIEVALEEKRGRDSGGTYRVPVPVFMDFLCGLNRRKWTGKIQVDNQRGRKSIYLIDGQVVFAESELFDDRLGGIAYREGIITLEELSRSAVQVTERRKFGQVLIQTNVFSNYGLWNSLKEQVRLILRSTFMVEVVGFSFEEGGQLPSTRVIFREGSLELIENAYMSGASFRSFHRQVDLNSQILILDDASDEQAGTFLRDLLSIIGTGVSVAEFLERAKLEEVYALEALLKLVHLGFCRLEGMKVFDSVVPEKNQFFKRYFQVYRGVLAETSAAFAVAQKPFPFDDLKRLASSLTLYLKPTGELLEECENAFYFQSLEMPHRSEFLLMGVRSLIEFLLVLTSDILAPELSEMIAKRVGY